MLFGYNGRFDSIYCTGYIEKRTVGFQAPAPIVDGGAYVVFCVLAGRVGFERYNEFKFAHIVGFDWWEKSHVLRGVCPLVFRVLPSMCLFRGR